METLETLDQLLYAVAQGDCTAFERLYDRTRSSVYALALSYLKNVCDAQDVTQDAFVRVWEHAPKYRPGKPMAWMLTITKNLALMRLRERGRVQDLEDWEWDAIPAQAELSPEDRMLLQGALNELGDLERRVVLLHAVSGLKHREIAGLLEMPLPTVLSKYHRALKKLHLYLERR